MSGSIGGINKQAAFLVAYGTCANLSMAAKSARITRDMHYQWMRTDAEYPALFAQAKVEAAQSLEDEAVRRAKDGVEKDVIYQGERCYEETTDPKTGQVTRKKLVTVEYSDSILLKLLAKFDPAGYRDKGSVEVTGANGGPVETALTVKFVKPE